MTALFDVSQDGRPEESADGDETDSALGRHQEEVDRLHRQPKAEAQLKQTNKQTEMYVRTME